MRSCRSGLAASWATFAVRTFATMPADRTAVDANVLVYALYRDAPQHAISRAFLERATLA
jgi:hypothetical protein